MQNPSKNGAAVNRAKPSTEFWAVLRKHLKIFKEHYRQEISEISTLAYAEDLCSLTAEQLEAACIEARRSSEFMPVSAAILAAHKRLLASAPHEQFLGPRLLAYSEIDPAERAKFVAELEANPAYQAAIAKLKIADPKPMREKPRIVPRPLMRSLEEQKRILRERGFLPALEPAEVRS
jgi:hypothetical protein